MDTQGPDFVDPADQWVLDPATGTYQLRLDPVDPGQPGTAPAAPSASPPATAASAASAQTSPEASAPPTPRPPSGGGRRAAPPASRRRRKPKQNGRRNAALWTAGAVGVVLVASGIGYLASGDGGQGVSTVDAGDAGAATLAAGGPLNLLIVGDPDGPAGGADATILLHVAADRADATALSIPRDLVTGIPDCPAGRSGVVPGSPLKGASPKLAESLGTDGRDPSCTLRLVRQLTGIPVDHLVEVDAAAVKALSTAVGGADVCLAHPIDDPGSGANLGAGRHKVEGDQALHLVRAPGLDGLDRIPVQQQFFAGLIRAAKSGGMFTDQKQRQALARTAAGALTVDTALGSVEALDSLAADLGKVDTKHITLTTLPVGDNAADPTGGTVVIDQAKAAQVFALIKNDVSFSQGSAKPDPRLTGSKATPHDTRVTVLNGSGVFGASQDVLNWLQNEQGVNRSANGGDAPAKLAATTLEYAPNQADQARSLAAMMGLPGSALHEGTKDAEPLAYMTLTLGADYTAPGAPIGPPTAPPKGLAMTTADRTACVG